MEVCLQAPGRLQGSRYSPRTDELMIGKKISKVTGRKTLRIMTKDTTTCDACGKRYVFTNYKDRCPVCCPDQARKDNVSDDYEQADWEDDD